MGGIVGLVVFWGRAHPKYSDGAKAELGGIVVFRKDVRILRVFFVRGGVRVTSDDGPSASCFFRASFPFVRGEIVRSFFLCFMVGAI